MRDESLPACRREFDAHGGRVVGAVIPVPPVGLEPVVGHGREWRTRQTLSGRQHGFASG